MKITTYSDFRQNLKSFFDSVVEDHAPLYVTRKTGEEVVVLSKEDFDSIQETLYLLSSPANALRLKESIEQYKSGKTKKHKLK